MKEDEVNGVGLTAGVIAWFGFVIYGNSQTSCIRLSYEWGCKGDDLLLGQIIGIGMLAPAWFVAFLVSGTWAHYVNRKK